MSDQIYSYSDTSQLALSIVVPVYRSAAILPHLVQRIHEQVQQLELDHKFELILVDDASPDDSWKQIEVLAQSYAFVKGFSLRRNFGQHNATMAGLSRSRGAIVVIMDDDLQHPPEALGAIISEIQAGHDVCYTQYRNRQHKAWKQLGSRFNGWMATLLLNKPAELYLSSFKAIKREVVSEILKYDGPYAYIDGLILDVTRSITSVEIDHQARMEGQSNYNLGRLISLWLKMATSFSVLPLRLASLAGILLSAVSLLMMAVVIVTKLMHPETAAGWASLISVTLFIGGIQTLCIGVMGEYLGRAYIKLNGKPQFVVGRTTENGVK